MYIKSFKQCIYALSVHMCIPFLMWFFLIVMSKSPWHKKPSLQIIYQSPLDGLVVTPGLTVSERPSTYFDTVLCICILGTVITVIQHSSWPLLHFYPSNQVATQCITTLCMIWACCAMAICYYPCEKVINRQSQYCCLAKASSERQEII